MILEGVNNCHKNWFNHSYGSLGWFWLLGVGNTYTSLEFVLCFILSYGRVIYLFSFRKEI